MLQLYRKGFIALLASMLLISLLAACGSSGGSNNPPAGSEKPANNDQQGKQQGTKKEEPAAPIKLQFLVPSYADVPNMEDEYWTEYQKRTNSELDVEWVPSGDYDTKFDLVLASGNLPEIIVTTNITRPTLRQAIKQGAFWDLTEFLGDFSKYPNMLEKSGPNVWTYMKLDGKTYGIPRNRPQIDLGIKMRKDWLDKLNLDVPTTLEEYTAALKQIVESDLDNNGKKDTIGIIGHGFLMADGDDTFSSAFGGLDPFYNEEGGLVRNFLTPSYTSMVEWFRQLYADGILAKEFSTMKKTQAEEMYATGRAASYVRNIWRDYTWEQDIKKVQPEANVITLPPLQGPGGVTVSLASPTFGAFYISKKVPEAKVWEILDYFERTTTDELTDFNYYGIEGIHHNLVDGQPHLTELGVRQVTTNANQVFSLAFNNKMKVLNPSAPKAYNDAKLESVQIYSEVGKLNPFTIINSDTWTAVWPKYEKEWQAMATKAIVGQITMQEYESNVEKLSKNEELKKAFQEFAASYKEYFEN